MRKTIIIAALAAASLTTVAQAAPPPGTTGANGGTYGPPPKQHRHRHHQHRQAGGISISDNVALDRAATTSTTATISSWGRGYARLAAGAALRDWDGGHWAYATYRSLDFKRHRSNRWRFEYFWTTRCCLAYGYVTVWPSADGGFYYYISHR